MQNPKTQITFTAEQMQKLKEIAKQNGNSVASIIRNLVAEYLRKMEGVQ